jgi:hypothetical protein
MLTRRLLLSSVLQLPPVVALPAPLFCGPTTATTHAVRGRVPPVSRPGIA